MTKEEVIKPKSVLEYLRAMQTNPQAIYDDAIIGMAADEIERLQKQIDECGHQCSAEMRAMQAEIDRLRGADEPKAPTAINAEGSRLMMELFNRMPVKALKEVPENIAKSIGDFMVANGYRFVFDRWYLQAEPKELESSAVNRTELLHRSLKKPS